MDSDRIPFLATPGGKTETIARAVMAERKAAYATRIEYMKAKGAHNLFGSDGGIAGIVVKEDAIPEGWRRDPKRRTIDSGIVVVPDGKKKATYAALIAELRALPEMPDGLAFSNRIGCPLVFWDRRMWYAYYEIVDGQIIVAIPTAKDPDDSEASKEQFIPADCVQLKHSEYWALKEKESAMGDAKNLPLVS